MSEEPDDYKAFAFSGPGLRSQLILTPLPPPPPPPPKPADCFAAMDEEIAAGGETTEIEPVLACPKTWVELTLLQDDGTPLANMPYRITAPGGEGLTGRLDANGHVRIEGTDIAPETATIKVSVTDDPNDPYAEPVYELQVVPRTALDVLAQEPPPDEPAQPEYFYSSFDRLEDPLDPDPLDSDPA